MEEKAALDNGIFVSGAFGRHNIFAGFSSRIQAAWNAITGGPGPTKKALRNPRFPRGSHSVRPAVLQKRIR